MVDPPDHELAVFSAARRLVAAERAAYLDDACDGDASLRRRVEELLQAAEEAAGFLEKPAAGPPASVRTISLTLPSLEQPGDRIGRYKLLQQIGEGGCGVVYMAEQEEPVRRRVALKVIKLGMDTKSVIARFEAERQALALMDHPNIAKVLDAGASETGRPYFVMELVRGVKITEYCDRNNVPTRERLGLFMQVCRAIQHAHQKGIIHRDIKPTNVLVTMNDGVPLPKVIDFGIAKATHGKLTDRTYFTAFEQFIGTPAYMSPEQAEMSALDVDTRSDIYSLGVLLYEMLTGRTPFDSKKMLQAGLDEIRRTIREQEPVRPSTRVSTMVEGELTSTARLRQTEPPKLVRLLRGDLDWIVMKALEKDRTRRYDSATGLAGDIQRHLNNEPVTAQPPTSFYRFSKLVRRNKVVFIAAATVAAALVTGLGFSTWSFFKEQQARQQAQSDRNKAEKETVKSQQVAGFLKKMLAGVGPEVALGRDTTMLREIMEKTRQQLDSELKDQPEVEAELLATIALAYYQLGDYAGSETAYRRALGLEERVSGKDDAKVIQLDSSLEETMIARGEYAAAEPVIRERLQRSQRLFGPTNEPVADALHHFGLILWKQGDLSRAIDMMRQSLTQWQQFQEPTNTSIVLSDIALVSMDQGDLAGAASGFREALDIREKLLPPGHPGLLIASNNLALARWYQGELGEAEAIYRGVVETERRIYKGGNADTAGTLNNLALVLRDRGDFAAAEPLQREALTMVENGLGKADPHAVIARRNLAALLRRRGAKDGDAEVLRESLKLDPGDPATADALADLMETPFLTPLAMDSTPAGTGWKWTSTAPETDWADPRYSDSAWPAASVIRGAPLFVPRTSKNPVLSHTNLWLRREFVLSVMPEGRLAVRINRNHDAQVFINGIVAAPFADRSDTGALLASTDAGRLLKAGRNVLGVHCEDADGDAPIDVRLYVTQDAKAGRQKLLSEFAGMIATETNRAELYESRAVIFARTGRWQEAAADLSKAIEIRPTESVAWYELSPLLLEMGDSAGFASLWRGALNRFSAADGPVVCGRVAVLSLLAPQAEPELATAGQLADVAASADYPDAQLGSRQFAKGLAEYRRGRLTAAVEWMDKTLATAGQQSLPGWSHEVERNRKAAAYLVEAMAQFQLHETKAAQTALNRGQEIIETQFPPAEGGDAGHDWPGLLTARILLREAQSVVR